MPHYRYRGLNPRKRSIAGRIWAVDKNHAQRQLEQQGLQMIFLWPPALWENWLERYKPASLQEQALCCRQLAIMMKSGIGIVPSLEILLRQPLHYRLYRAYDQCYSAVQNGSSLSQSMRQSPGVFDELYIGLVRVGEKTGRLMDNLEEASLHLERELNLRAKVQAALTYPLVITVFSLTMAYLMVQHILPRFINGLFAESQVALPWYTQLLIQVTQLFQQPATVALGGLVTVALGWLAIGYFRTEAGRIQLHEAFMTWKPSKDFCGKIMAVRSARMIASGVEAGLTVSDSLELTSQACGNPYLARFLEIANEDLKDGAPLSLCLGAIPFFPPMISAFIQLGEEAGALPQVLKKAAEMLELDIDEVIQAFTQLLEPVLVGVMGGFVGFVLISLFVPIYQMLGAT